MSLENVKLNQRVHCAPVTVAEAPKADRTLVVGRLWELKAVCEGDPCTCMSFAALGTLRNGNSLWPSLMKLWYVLGRILSSSENKTLLFAETWTELEIVVFSEIARLRKTVLCSHAESERVI